MACRTLEASTELSSLQASATQAAPPLGSSEEGGVAPICAEMLRNVVHEMHRFERVITHWPLFGPYLEAAVCVVLRAVLAAVSRQCGMTRVRPGPEAAGGSPFKLRAASPAPGLNCGDMRYARQDAMATTPWDPPHAQTGQERNLPNLLTDVVDALPVQGWQPSLQWRNSTVDLDAGQPPQKCSQWLPARAANGEWLLPLGDASMSRSCLICP